jgi:FkbM family methyltransferase
MTETATDLDGLLGAGWRAAAERRRSQIADRIGDRRDVLLFGAGYLGRHALADMSELRYRPLAFVDNNPAIWGTQIDGLEVIGPDDAVRRYGGQALWLITVYTNSRVMAQCEALGVPWVTCAELSWTLPAPHPPSFVFGTPDTLTAWSADVETAARIWADAESEVEYRSQVQWRFLLDYAALPRPRDPAETYFPDDLVRPLADEVFVDCGAFTGDTVEAFLASREGRFSEIVAVEPDAVNGQVLLDRVADWKRAGVGPITVEPVAVGSARGTLTFATTGTAGSRVGSGTETVEVAPLDELLATKRPTYMKFDVEGAERDGLMGASQTIRAHAPVLAVCLYHKPEDLWDLPLLVRSMRPDYRFHVRRYSDERWETILYAIPPDRTLD